MNVAVACVIGASILMMTDNDKIDALMSHIGNVQSILLSKETEKCLK